MANLVRNERTKLTATYLNGVAIAVVAVGGFAPLITAANSVTALWTTIAPTSVICLFISGTLHLTARRILKGLKDDE